MSVLRLLELAHTGQIDASEAGHAYPGRAISTFSRDITARYLVA
jgi:hypothetical protein